jgi:hypothetical protein
MAAQVVDREVAVYVMGVALDGFYQTADGHKDHNTGEWRLF